MSTWRQGSIVVLVLLVWVVAACGGPVNTRDGGATQNGDGQNGDGQDGDGQDGGGDGNGGLGAPIMIPSIVQDQGRPLDEVAREIDSGIREQCGNDDLCVTLVVEQHDEPCCTACQFVRTEPPQGSEVERGTTVVIVSGSSPCPTEPASETVTFHDAARDGTDT